MSNGGVAEKLHITGATGCKWRVRFRVNRVEGLLDGARVGAPRSITDGQVEDVVTKTLESMPAQGTHWSTRAFGNLHNKAVFDTFQFRQLRAAH